jgi:hypothetical protein
MKNPVIVVTGSVPQTVLVEAVRASFRRLRAGKGMSGCCVCGGKVDDPKNTNTCDKCLKEMLG